MVAALPGARLSDTGPQVPEASDPYAKLQYGRLFAWPERLQREGPFLLQVLQEGPEPSLLDLGCGTGEHALHFAGAGYRVLGVDRSEAQLEQARPRAAGTSARFVAGDLVRLHEALGEERFGTAFCLGNTLVHLQEAKELAAACRGVHAALRPGGAWVIQILNYARLAQGERHLPLQFRPDAEGEIVFLRLLRHLPDRRLQFFPTTLRLRPEAAVPVEVVSSHVTTLRGWQRDELEPELHQAGFESIVWYGDLCGNPFQPQSSTDLVCVARRH